MESGGRRLLLDCGKDGVRVLENGDADEKEETLGMGGAVVVKKDTDLRCLMAASLMSSETLR